MKRLMIIALCALALGLAPFGLQTRADDAHHPDKAAKAAKSTKGKAAKKKPVAKSKKTSARDAWSGTYPAKT